MSILQAKFESIYSRRYSIHMNTAFFFSKAVNYEIGHEKNRELESSRDRSWIMCRICGSSLDVKYFYWSHNSDPYGLENWRFT